MSEALLNTAITQGYLLVEKSGFPVKHRGKSANIVPIICNFGIVFKWR